MKTKVMVSTLIAMLIIVVGAFFALTTTTRHTLAMSCENEKSYLSSCYIVEIDYINEEHNFVQTMSSRRTVFGGDLVRRRNFFGFVVDSGTITINAMCNETREMGVLTARHVLQDYFRAYARQDYSNIFIGRSTSAHRDMTTDSAFVPFRYQDNWNVTPNVRYGNTTFTNIRLGTEELIVRAYNEGLPTMKIGLTTGITYGIIAHPHHDAVQTGSIFWGCSGTMMYYNTILLQSYGSPGDSGGPVFIVENGFYYLVGMIIGGSPTTDATWVVRITKIMENLNITPITNDNYHGIQILRYGQFNNIGTNLHRTYRLCLICIVTIRQSHYSFNN